MAFFTQDLVVVGGSSFFAFSEGIWFVARPDQEKPPPFRTAYKRESMYRGTILTCTFIPSSDRSENGERRPPTTAFVFAQ